MKTLKKWKSFWSSSEIFNKERRKQIRKKKEKNPFYRTTGYFS